MPPNVLLFITDQQRWDTLGFTGRTPCRTPHLDRLARGGASFDRCLTPDPICCPARASLFTGRYPHATGVGNNRELPLERPALPEVFRDAGYHVAHSGKWHLGQGRAAAGFDAFAGERGRAYKEWLAAHNIPDTYPYGQEAFSFRMPGPSGAADAPEAPSVPDAREAPSAPQAGAAMGGRRISNPHTAPQEGLTAWTYDSWVADRALEHLETRPRDRPFFHVCSFHGPHPVFVVPEPYYGLYDPALAPEPANFADPMTDKPAFQTRSIWHGAARAHGTTWEPWRRSQSVYWGYVTLLDELIGRVLGRLESLDLAQDTVVVMISDHGEQMGSHGLFQKSCMYEEALRVPLLVRAPGRVAPGRRLAAPVSHADVAPTLLALAGLQAPGGALLEPQGRDLTPWLAPGSPSPSPVSFPSSPSSLQTPAPVADDDPAAGAVFCEYKPYPGEGMTDIRCIAGPRYKLAWNRDDRDELYDTWADPAELRNRAGDPALAPVERRLRERLLRWMRETDDPLTEAVARATPGVGPPSGHPTPAPAVPCMT